jgi:hypothetical protein
MLHFRPLPADLSALREALKDRDAADERLAAVLVHDFPRGGPVAWSGIECFKQSGTVLEHCSGGYVKVRTDLTGLERIVSARDIARVDQ